MPDYTESSAPLIVAFIPVLRERWPDLLDLAVLEADGSLRIVLASPHRNDGQALMIQADPDFDELIIGFGFSHSHGGPWQHEGDPDFEFKSSIEFIQGIFDERIVACQYARTYRIWHLDALQARADWSTVTRIISWRGTHDSLASPSEAP